MGSVRWSVRLPVSAAFHSRLVQDARAPFADVLKQVRFTPAQIPVFSNTTAEPYPADTDRAVEMLADHLLYPVDFAGEEMWEELVQLHADGKLDEKFSKTYIFTEERPMYEFYDLLNHQYEEVDRCGDPAYKDAQQELMSQLHRWMIIYRDVVPLPIAPPRRQ